MKGNLKMLIVLGAAACISMACGNKTNEGMMSTEKSTVSAEKNAGSSTAAEKAAESEEKNPIEAVKTEEKQLTEGTVSNTVDMSHYEKGRKVRLWLPVPHSSEYQTVSDVAYDAGNAKAEMNTDGLGNQMLYVEWDENAEPADRVVKLNFNVKREAVIRPELKEDDKEEFTDEVKKYLEPSKNLPLNDQLKEKGREVTEGKDYRPREGKGHLRLGHCKYEP